MGLGKTFVGSEKMKELDAKVNLVVCQKSKLEDWFNHFKEYYADYVIYDLTVKGSTIDFLEWNKFEDNKPLIVGVINYDLVFRRPELMNLRDFTLMLDESSLIQNESSKRSKFIIHKLNPKNVILLSGTPTSGKYEKLWSQLHLLGWNISKKLYWKQYIITETIETDGFPIQVVRGYKNVERLKQKLREHGADFLKTEEVFNLPEQIDNVIKIPTTKEYRKFKKDKVVEFDDIELIGDTSLTEMLYQRQLCAQYNSSKIKAYADLVDSTNDRLIVFYNFNEELAKLRFLTDRPKSYVNGNIKDLSNFEKFDDSITFVQYQAGAMGLNLQKANKIIYFSPPLSSELFEQSKKRTHRIGQKNACMYYYLVCRNSIEEKIYETLKMRKDYTDELFRESE